MLNGPKNESRRASGPEEAAESPIMYIQSGLSKEAQTCGSSEEDEKLACNQAEDSEADPDDAEMLGIEGDELVGYAPVCDTCFGKLLEATKDTDGAVYGALLDTEQHEVTSDGSLGLVERPCMVCDWRGAKHPVGTPLRAEVHVLEWALSRAGARAGMLRPGGLPDEAGTVGQEGVPGDAARSGAARAPSAVAEEPRQRVETPARAAGHYAPPVDPTGPDWELMLAAAQRASQRVDWLVAEVADAARRGDRYAFARLNALLDAAQTTLGSFCFVLSAELGRTA